MAVEQRELLSVIFGLAGGGLALLYGLGVLAEAWLRLRREGAPPGERACCCASWPTLVLVVVLAAVLYLLREVQPSGRGIAVGFLLGGLLGIAAGQLYLRAASLSARTATGLEMGLDPAVALPAGVVPPALAVVGLSALNLVQARSMASVVCAFGLAALLVALLEQGRDARLRRGALSGTFLFALAAAVLAAAMAIGAHHYRMSRVGLLFPLAISGDLMLVLAVLLSWLGRSPAEGLPRRLLLAGLGYIVLAGGIGDALAAGLLKQTAFSYPMWIGLLLALLVAWAAWVRVASGESPRALIPEAVAATALVLGAGVAVAFLLKGAFAVGLAGMALASAAWGTAGMGLRAGGGSPREVVPSETRAGLAAVAVAGATVAAAALFRVLLEAQPKLSSVTLERGYVLFGLALGGSLPFVFAQLLAHEGSGQERLRGWLRALWGFVLILAAVLAVAFFWREVGLAGLTCGLVVAQFLALFAMLFAGAEPPAWSAASVQVSLVGLLGAILFAPVLLQHTGGEGRLVRVLVLVIAAAAVAVLGLLVGMLARPQKAGAA